MMCVENYLDKSPIHGIGVYAGAFIPRGTLIWEFTPGFDQVHPDASLAQLTPVQRAIVLFYCYREPGLDGVVLCCDNARHYNFDANPNSGTGPRPTRVHGCLSTFALRDIQPGEELTYAVEEDDDALRKLGGGEIVASPK
jgi:uncharacterized protein